MPEALWIMMLLLLLVAAFVLTQRISHWRAQRTFHSIIEDLKKRGAIDEVTAVELPYAKRNMFRPGLRDFRIEGLQFLVVRDVVGRTDEGKYYIKNTAQLDT